MTEPRKKRSDAGVSANMKQIGEREPTPEELDALLAAEPEGGYPAMEVDRTPENMRKVVGTMAKSIEVAELNSTLARIEAKLDALLHKVGR